MKLKHYNKEIFNGSILRYWTGEKWRHANLKRWNGTEWESCTKAMLSDFFVDTSNSCLVKPNGELVKYYNSKYFTSPYVYYYKNKLSYRIINHYKGDANPWSMDIEIWNPWTEKLMMRKNIPHANASSSEQTATEFKSSISVTNDKIFVFYTPLNIGNVQKGVYVVVLDLNLRVLTQSNLTANGNKIEEYVYTLNDTNWGGVTRRNGTDYVYTYNKDDYPTIAYRGIKINYDNGVCVSGNEIKYAIYSDAQIDLKDLYKLGLNAQLHMNTGGGNTPMYDWRLTATFKDLVLLSYISTGGYPSTLFKGGAIVDTRIEEFKYGGMQRSLNNAKLFGVLLQKSNTHLLDGCIFALDSDKHEVAALSGTDENYLTFRKILGDPSLGYVIYKNMNGINLANKILNFDYAKNKIEFRHLPNGQTLMYFDNDIFNFAQKNDKFYISYYGTQIKAFAENVIEPYGCNKEIIE